MKDYSSLVLAYIGDAHYGLTVKKHLIEEEEKVDLLQQRCNSFVSARSQAKAMEYLLENNLLTDEETDVYKRGRNSKSHKAPKNTDVVTYHVSTGFEALWGYLYVNERWNRLEQLWNIIKTVGGD